MIAADTSSIIAFLEGDAGKDVDLIGEALNGKRLILPPVVQTELLSYPDMSKELSTAITVIPLAELKPGYWRRAGENRAKIISKGYKARIADALIAQTCIDNDLILVTRDKDFRPFSDYCKLKLV